MIQLKVSSNAGTNRKHVDHTGMTRCLVKELTSLIKLSGIKTVTSVYFGGGNDSIACVRLIQLPISYPGTPSLAEPRTIEAVINTVREQTCLKHNAEVTLEANPTSAQTERLRFVIMYYDTFLYKGSIVLYIQFRTFRLAGVTRLSIGFQVYT